MLPLCVLRVCADGRMCEGEASQSETQDCNTEGCECTITLDVLKEQLNLPEDFAGGVVGWVEEDNVPGRDLTENPTEVGDKLAIGDVVQIGDGGMIGFARECGTW